MPFVIHKLIPTLVSLSAAFVFFVSTSTLVADISLPKIFSDHMVLQRNSKVKIWGSADANQKLKIKFAEKEVKTTADNRGNWIAYITTPGSGGPYELEIAAEEGEPKVVFSDVLVGEVWLCAGDNMNAPVSESLNAKTEIAQSKNYHQIRLFSVSDSPSVLPQTDFANVVPWRVSSPESVKDFSAIAYFFGRELGKELKDVPIGLIDASWQWTVCEAWCSRQSLDQVDSLAPLLKFWDESDTPPTDQSRPGVLFNGMIAPLKKFPICGVIWYQGETNHGRGQQYATLFPTLIRDWRRAFGNDKMPFYFVGLSQHRYEGESPTGLAEIWDAQLKTLKSVENTGMVVTTDIAANPKEIHPKNKQEVGRRLSLIALSTLYKNQIEKDKKIVASGPVYDSMSSNKDRVRVVFKHAKGLRTGNGDASVNNFLICGEDEVFFPAQAKIDGEAIEVSSPEVKNPVHVRYCWSDSFKQNLVNDAGLPASPFRTDDFPLDSAGRDF